MIPGSGAVIDEARWPRMFGVLQRAGIPATANCGGCRSCQAEARRLLLGVASAPRYRETYAWGGETARWVALSRDLDRRRRVGVLVDVSNGPRIVDVAIGAAEGSAFENETGEAEKPSADGPLGTRTGPLQPQPHHAPWTRAIQLRDDWPGGAATRDRLKVIPELIERAIGQPQSWQGTATLLDLARVPETQRGLYLIVWPHGAYLGRSLRANGILGRLREHVQDLARLSFQPPTSTLLAQYRVIWLPWNEGVDRLELQYRNAIAGRARLASRPGPREARRNEFIRAGFRNVTELEAEGVDGQGEITLGSILDNHLQWQLDQARRRALHEQWTKRAAYRGDEGKWWGPVSLFNFPDGPMSPGAREALGGPGLYLVVWPRGHYLGKTEAPKQSLRNRILTHARDTRKLCGSLVHHRVFWLGLTRQENIAAQEAALHGDIVAAARRFVGQPGRLTQEQLFRTLGFTNAKVGGEL